MFNKPKINFNHKFCTKYHFIWIPEMNDEQIPFNIDFLQLNNVDIKKLGKVTSLDILEPSKQTFHPDGLWSTVIFGQVGSERRNNSFGYIDIKLPVLHPVLYKQLTSAKTLYKGILNSKEYAVWSDAECDFIKSDPIDGKTGYSFFISHFSQLKLKDTNTIKRKQLIRLLEKRDKTLNRYIIVMPAGLRDVEFDPNTKRMSMDDVNSFYRKLIVLSNNITEASMSSNSEYMDTTRASIQNTFVDLYEYISNLVEGKKKLFLNKFASRRIFNGTRNVITAFPPGGRFLGDKTNVRHNNTIIGLFQMLKAILPIACKQIKDGFLSKVFLDPNMPIKLVNAATLTSEEIIVDSSVYDRYQSNEGIEKLIQNFSQESIRHKPIMIEGRYLGLMYKGPDNTFKIIQDIKEIPEDRSRDDVEPLTYMQLLYCSCYEILNNKYPLIIARYPIAGTGSVPSTLPYCKTTTESEIRYELDESWHKLENPAVSFPITNGTTVNSMSPPSSSLSGMAADFDGDVISANAVYSDEAIEENLDFLNSFKAYIDSSGRISRSMGYDTVNFVCYNLSGD